MRPCVAPPAGSRLRCPRSFVVGCPGYTQGETYEEAVHNAEDAIRLHVEDRLAAGETIDQAEQVSPTTLEVAERWLASLP